jgi:hypothetical protein
VVVVNEGLSDEMGLVRMDHGALPVIPGESSQCIEITPTVTMENSWGGFSCGRQPNGSPEDMEAEGHAQGPSK